MTLRPSSVATKATVSCINFVAFKLLIDKKNIDNNNAFVHDLVPLRHFVAIVFHFP